jgi:hypothetical protein
MRPSLSALLLCLIAGLVGCSGEHLAPVSGKVTFKGTPVDGGTLIFSPVSSEAIAGRPASAEIGKDGSYTLQTQHPGDGAVVGRHHITFTPPPQELTEAQRTDRRYIAPPPKYMGLVPRDAEVEVKPGPNTIDIELVSHGR